MKRRLWLIIAVALLLVGCESATPAPRPTHTALPSLAPSPTVNPVLPTVDPNAAFGVNSPTAAAAPNDMDVDEFAPLPSEEAFRVMASSDGLALRGTLYRASVEPAPAVLLLHMLGGSAADWAPLVTPLQQAGYTVLTIDLRGHGATGGEQDWEAARQDVVDVLAALRDVDGVNALRVGVVGASIGANLGLTGCVTSTFCRTVVLLSPGLDYRGVLTEGAITGLGERSALLVASEGDTYSAETVRVLDGLATARHETLFYGGGGHGTSLFAAQPGLVDTVLAWLDANL